MDALDTPFATLDPSALLDISSSPGFQILRRCLHSKQLGRDMLHAMIMPVVQLFKRASTLAAPALCTNKQEVLELAFRGEARDAFVWLQVFIAEEGEWCQTIGCPACVMAQTVSTESTIRATMAAALVSAHTTPNSLDDSTGLDTGNMSTNPTLPSFIAVLPALSNCLNDDPFWGSDFSAHLRSRAERTYIGIKDLIYQCHNLEALVLSQPSSPSEHLPIEYYATTTADLSSEALSKLRHKEAAQHGQPLLTPVQSPISTRAEEIRLKKGKWARRQSRLRQEEREVLLRAVWEAWSVQEATLKAQRQQQPWTLGPKCKGEKLKQERRRSLTCP